MQSNLCKKSSAAVYFTGGEIQSKTHVCVAHTLATVAGSAEDHYGSK